MCDEKKKKKKDLIASWGLHSVVDVGLFWVPFAIYTRRASRRLKDL